MPLQKGTTGFEQGEDLFLRHDCSIRVRCALRSDFVHFLYSMPPSDLKGLTAQGTNYRCL
jgi:hypothetical protein